MAASKTLPYFNRGSVAATPNISPNLCPPYVTTNSLTTSIQYATLTRPKLGEVFLQPQRGQAATRP